jgi:acyl carrier protein
MIRAYTATHYDFISPQRRRGRRVTQGLLWFHYSKTLIIFAKLCALYASAASHVNCLGIKVCGVTMQQSSDSIDERVRALLARVLELEPSYVQALPESTPLFGSGLSLDSLTGLELLTGVEAEFGVDIAAEDLNLDSLGSIGTLVAYLLAHSDSSQIAR